MFQIFQKVFTLLFTFCLILIYKHLLFDYFRFVLFFLILFFIPRICLNSWIKNDKILIFHLPTYSRRAHKNVHDTRVEIYVIPLIELQFVSNTKISPTYEKSSQIQSPRAYNIILWSYLFINYLLFCTIWKFENFVFSLIYLYGFHLHDLIWL